MSFFRSRKSDSLAPTRRARFAVRLAASTATLADHVGHRVTVLLAVTGLALVSTSSTPSPAAAAASTSYCTPSTSGVIPRPDLAAQLLGQINVYRVQHGLNKLQLSPALERSATWKAESTARWQFVPPTTDDPATADSPARSWEQRLSDCGVPSGSYTGELFATIAGSGDAAPPFF